MGIFKKIKWALQRAIRGYDERLGWDVQEYLENIFLSQIVEYTSVVEVQTEAYVESLKDSTLGAEIISNAEKMLAAVRRLGAVSLKLQLVTYQLNAMESNMVGDKETQERFYELVQEQTTLREEFWPLFGRHISLYWDVDIKYDE